MSRRTPRSCSASTDPACRMRRRLKPTPQQGARWSCSSGCGCAAAPAVEAVVAHGAAVAATPAAAAAGSPTEDDAPPPASPHDVLTCGPAAARLPDPQEAAGLQLDRNGAAADAAPSDGPSAEADDSDDDAPAASGALGRSAAQAVATSGTRARAAVTSEPHASGRDAPGRPAAPDTMAAEADRGGRLSVRHRCGCSAK